MLFKTGGLPDSSHRNLRHNGRTYLAHKCKNELGPERYHTPYILPPDRSYCRVNGLSPCGVRHLCDSRVSNNSSKQYVSSV
jgi:hypothetical protein